MADSPREFSGHGERLLDERGVFRGAYGWRDARTLIGKRGD